MSTAEIDSYYAMNRLNWNDRAKIHARSRFYDLDGLQAGGNNLLPTELTEMGDVTGKTLLHLQCHIGTDTLSWAKLGAKVTGVDMSDVSLQIATELAGSLNIDAEFINANVYDLAKVLASQYDIVYTSYGVLCWLHDIESWAQIASSYVKPGGFFYVVDFHPLANSLDEKMIDNIGNFAYPYFPKAEPLYNGPSTSYVEEDESTSHGCYQWFYNLGQVVSALSSAGLQIEFLHEHPVSACSMFDGMTKRSDGLWVRHNSAIPLTFSIKATKP